MREDAAVFGQVRQRQPLVIAQKQYAVIARDAAAAQGSKADVAQLARASDSVAPAR